LTGGLSGKNSDKKDPDLATKITTYCKKTIDDYFCKGDQVEFFIFTWQTDIVNSLKEIYAAKVCISEKQPTFPVPKDAETTPRTQNHIARWYGYKKIIDELKKWSLQNNIAFDYIINARFDLCWNRSVTITDRNKILLGRYSGWAEGKQNGRFSQEDLFDLDFWPKQGRGAKGFSKIDLADHIFGGTLDFMNALGGIYDKIEYLHSTKKYGRGTTMSHHRLLPGMLQEIGIKQDDIIYLNHYNHCGLFLEDYDLFRYRNLKKENLT
jgi:hypothetical protein